MRGCVWLSAHFQASAALDGGGGDTWTSLVILIAISPGCAPCRPSTWQVSTGVVASPLPCVETPACPT